MCRYSREDAETPLIAVSKCSYITLLYNISRRSNVQMHYWETTIYLVHFWLHCATVLHKSQFQIAATLLWNYDLDSTFIINYTLYCINHRSGAKLHRRTICYLCSTFVVELCTVLHKSQFCSEDTLFCNNDLCGTCVFKLRTVRYNSQFRSAVTSFWTDNLCTTYVLKLRTVLHQSEFLRAATLLYGLRYTQRMYIWDPF